MTEEQKIFIWLAYAEKVPFPMIARKMGLPLSRLTTWNKELEADWRVISRIAKIYQLKIEQPANGQPIPSLREFHEWFVAFEQNKCCYYCGITETQLAFLWDNKLVVTKRSRGRSLEFDRVLPNAPYSDLSNIVYACYWCNNAKTDTFTGPKFQQVGEAIAAIWRQRLATVSR